MLGMYYIVSLIKVYINFNRSMFNVPISWKILTNICFLCCFCHFFSCETIVFSICLNEFLAQKKWIKKNILLLNCQRFNITSFAWILNKSLNIRDNNNTYMLYMICRYFLFHLWCESVCLTFYANGLLLLKTYVYFVFDNSLQLNFHTLMLFFLPFKCIHEYLTGR